MYLLFSILAVLISIVLVFFVVIQNSKGGGLAAGFSSSNQVMGVRKTTDFLEKATWSLAAAIVVLSIAASLSMSFGNKNATNDSSIRDEIQNTTLPANQNAVPNFGTPVPANNGQGNGQATTPAPVAPAPASSTPATAPAPKK